MFRGWGPAVWGTLSSFPEAKCGPPLSTCHTGPQRAKTPYRGRRGQRGAASLLMSALHLLVPPSGASKPLHAARVPGVPFTRAEGIPGAAWPLGEFYYYGKQPKQ